MRKLLCSLLLPLLLLLTQQGALVHELSHLGEARGPAAAVPQGVAEAAIELPAPAPSTPFTAPDGPSAPSAPHAGHALCGLCLAFAHLAGPLASGPAVLVLLDLHHALAGAAPVLAVPADAPTARSRGPPVFL